MWYVKTCKKIQTMWITKCKQLKYVVYNKNVK